MKTDDRYWRSLEDRAGDDEARAFREAEFPAPFDESGLSRRSVLLLMASSLSLAGASACRRPAETIVPYVEAPEEIVPGIPRQYATTIPLGPSASGIVVESHEGRPTKIEGNELHPVSNGAASARTQAAVYDLYDPDRSRTPLERGKARSWADFESAWQDLVLPIEFEGGSNLAILSRPFSSPTQARLRAALAERFPKARWVTYDPVGDENVRKGLIRATGTDVDPVYHVEKAQVILSLDSDFLMTGPDALRHARGFANGRRVDASAGSMNRLYAVESTLTVTGAMADHRLRLRSSEILRFLSVLAREVAGLPLPSEDTPEHLGADPAWIRRVARDLAANRGKALIVAGAHQPPLVHAAVHALNATLGSVGSTVTYYAPLDSSRSDVEALRDLIDSIRKGDVSTLVVLGGNPVYDAPADLDFAGALERLDTSIHLSTHVDETSARATWHLPEAHFLETWGDTRAVGGPRSVVQPLIQPLFEGRSSIELLSFLAFDEFAKGHDLVRDTWTAYLGSTRFESRWQRVLHDGLLRESPEAVTPDFDMNVLHELRKLPELQEAPKSDIELVFQPSRAVGDGSGANNAWLQELPDSITKLTWDNVLYVSPATAQSLDVDTGDVLRVGAGDRSVELPAFVLPGQADGSVTATLGYGRTRAGSIGNGVGVDVFPLRTSSAPWILSGVSLEVTGKRHRLASTQTHGSMEGRPIALEANVEEFRHDPKVFREHLGEHPPLESLWTERAYAEGHQWGMTIDLNACIGCNACVVACQSENNVPVVGKDQVSRGREMHWIRIDRYFSGDESDVQVTFQPVPCMHCENAPCEQVCPVAATVHDSEGLNLMVYNRCIGTRYCSNNCPYKVRRFNFYNLTRDTPETLQMARNPDVTVRSRGVMEKCTYCIQRIQKTKIDARMEERPIRDGELQTACQQTCPTRAIEFGDLLDRESRVARLKTDPRNYNLLEELNTKPRTSYLGRLRNPGADNGQA